MNHHPGTRWAVTLSWFGVVLFTLFAVGHSLAQVRAPALPQAPLEILVPVGTSFTYQGQLKDRNGAAITDFCDFQFILYDDEEGGSQVGQTLNLTASVTEGYFTTVLGFGSDVFTGEARWLGVAVKCSGDADYTPLSPRQPLTPAPYALNADLLDGQHAASFASTGHTHTGVYAPYSHTHAGEDITSGVVAEARIDGALARDIEIWPTVLSNDGSGSTLDADLLDGLHADEFAGVDHNHWGQSWTGAGTGLAVSGGAVGLEGSGSTYGVYGQSESASGWAGYFFSPIGAGVGINAPPGGIALEVQQGQVQVAEGIRYPDGVFQTEGFFRPRLPGPGSTSIIDSSGGFSTITIGADGLGLISYPGLKVLHCGNIPCNSANTITSVDSEGSAPSITIGPDGLGLISYTDSTWGLKVLHCGNTRCNSGNTITTVDSAGASSSITIGTDGLGLISYFDSISDDLKVLHCGNTRCNSGNTITTADSGGASSSITIGADGLGLISYYDDTGYRMVLHCGNSACSSGNTITTVDSEGDFSFNPTSSITIGADGVGLISYFDADNGLKVLHCGNTTCNSGNTITSVDNGDFSGENSITIGADGLGLVSYTDYAWGLKVLHCGNVTCNSGNTITLLDSEGDNGYYTAITIGLDGWGLISYWDSLSGLKVFKCSNLACQQYIRVGR